MLVLIWLTLVLRSDSVNSVLSKKPSVTIPPLIEDQQVTLTCTAAGLCSGSDPNITWTWRGIEANSSYSTENITASEGPNSTLTFKPSAKHHSTTITCTVSCTGDETTGEEETVTLNVNYVKKPEIAGQTTVKEGDALNLTCTVDSFPPSVITWTKHDVNTSLINETGPGLNNDTGTSTLVIQNVTAEDSGQYFCVAKHLNIQMQDINVTVMLLPKILNDSGCEVYLGVLTCVCISHGFPLPTIKWPLLENRTEYSVITTVSNHTVISKVILSMGSSSTSAECVSRNENGEIKGNLIVNKAAEEGPNMKLFRIVTKLETVVTFFIGTLFSASFFCLVWMCCRNKKQRNRGNLPGTLEMVMNQEDPLINAGQAVEEDQIHDQEMLEGAEAAGGKSDVDYSNIDFSLLQRKNPAEAGTTETEYAEIKKEAAEEGPDGEGKGEKELLGEDEETKHHAAEEEDGEDVAVYSNVQDILDQM